MLIFCVSSCLVAQFNASVHHCVAVKVSDAGVRLVECGLSVAVESVVVGCCS